MAAGNLTDGASHAATEGAVFCIPATANGTVNLVIDLPGPGATSLPGIAQIVPTPTPWLPCDSWRSSAARGRARDRARPQRTDSPVAAFTTCQLAGLFDLGAARASPLATPPKGTLLLRLMRSPAG